MEKPKETLIPHLYLIGKELRIIRVTRGLRQGVVCKELKISQAYLSQIENGTRFPSMKVLKKLTERYDAKFKIIY